jgi:hypothetical protein
MDTPLLNEGTLRVGNKIVHKRAKAGGKHLCNYFSNGMDEANRSKIGDLLRTIFLWQERNIRGVEPMKFFNVKVAKEVNDPHNVHLDDLPTFLEKTPVKPSGSGALSLGIWLIAHLTSSSEKGAPRQCKSGSSK